jgi:uncharacterized protein
METPMIRAWMGLLTLVAAASATRAADLPPLADTTPEHAHFPGKFVWADLFTGDPDSALAFYRGLFGWEGTTIQRTTRSGVHPYIVLRNQGEPVAGIARLPSRMPEPARGRWIGYVSVDSVQAALATVTTQHGRVLFPAKELPQRGTQAIFIDPEGGELGLLQSSSGDPGEYAADMGEWTWAQLFAKDPAALGRFYAAVVGWEILPDPRGQRPDVFVATSGEYSRASLAPIGPRPGAHPGWLLLIRVPDVKATVAKVGALGGRVLVPPSDAPAEYWRAVIADPTGAVLGLVQLQAPDEPKEEP